MPAAWYIDPFFHSICRSRIAGKINWIQAKNSLNSFSSPTSICVSLFHIRLTILTDFYTQEIHAFGYIPASKQIFYRIYSQ